eukprot:scaffold69590_cov33-Attheya_sp.AAC.1
MFIILCLVGARIARTSQSRVHSFTDSREEERSDAELRLPFAVSYRRSSLQRPFFPDTFEENEYKSARSIRLVKGYPTLFELRVFQAITTMDTMGTMAATPPPPRRGYIIAYAMPA